MTAIKLLSLFSGIGAFEKALDKVGGYELVNYCEIDKFASKAYSLIHNEPITKNLVDVTKIDCDKLPKGIDLVTYGFPCQDISIAGKQKGLSDSGVQTRSGLVFDALRIIEEVKPKYAICENVKNLTGKKFTQEFKTILETLNEIGYNNYWKVLNAADYGVPQKRERVFIVSIRKDIDKGSFEFPEPFVLTKSLKDVLEDEVDPKYFLSEKLVNFFYENMKKQKVDKVPQVIGGVGEKKFGKQYRQGDRIYDVNTVSPALASQVGNAGKGSYLIKLTELTKGVAQAKRVYDSNGLSVTLKGEAGGLGAKTGLYKIHNKPDLKVLYHGKSQSKHLYDAQHLAATSDTGNTPCYSVESDIRKLTPKECFRLMGFDDKDVDVLKANNISDTQLYKMAGNSIVVDVLYYIFKQLFKDV